MTITGDEPVTINQLKMLIESMNLGGGSSNGNFLTNSAAVKYAEYSDLSVIPEDSTYVYYQAEDSATYKNITFYSNYRYHYTTIDFMFDNGTWLHVQPAVSNIQSGVCDLYMLTACNGLDLPEKNYLTPTLMMSGVTTFCYVSLSKIEPEQSGDTAVQTVVLGSTLRSAPIVQSAGSYINAKVLKIRYSNTGSVSVYDSADYISAVLNPSRSSSYAFTLENMPSTNNQINQQCNNVVIRDTNGDLFYGWNACTYGGSSYRSNPIMRISSGVITCTATRTAYNTIAYAFLNEVNGDIIVLSNDTTVNLNGASYLLNKSSLLLDSFGSDITSNQKSNIGAFVSALRHQRYAFDDDGQEYAQNALNKKVMVLWDTLAWMNGDYSISTASRRMYDLVFSASGAPPINSNNVAMSLVDPNGKAVFSGYGDSLVVSEITDGIVSFSRLSGFSTMAGNSVSVLSTDYLYQALNDGNDELVTIVGDRIAKANISSNYYQKQEGLSNAAD